MNLFFMVLCLLLLQNVKMTPSILSAICSILKWAEGLRWWRSGWESACQCRGHGFKPWSGRIPRAAEQLSLCAAAAEPPCLQPLLRAGRGHHGEKPRHRSEEWPPLAATGESLHAAAKTQCSQK